jgi:hypothetical protein
MVSLTLHKHKLQHEKVFKDRTPAFPFPTIILKVKELRRRREKERKTLKEMEKFK